MILVLLDSILVDTVVLQRCLDVVGSCRWSLSRGRQAARIEHSLSARIAAHVRQHPGSPRERNRAVFLALLPEIRQALDEGWSVITIWRTLHAEQKVTFSYQAFRLYVKKLILAPARGTPSTPSLPREPVPTKGTTGFTFNPVPNKEELI
ncbi:MAG: hypothetical protein A4S17_14280 [Proteobacteria bacterium HN_bin10]|nr:MAG: hypothetical protein A4S17_14280 [Proteobacteria bacterium HN_bin10]